MAVTLGQAIGLQGKPNDYAGLFMSSMNQIGRDKALARARSKQSEDNLNKLVTSKDLFVQPGSFHKLYQNMATKAVSDFINTAYELRNKNPNDYMPAVMQEYVKTHGTLSRYKYNSDILKKYESDAVTSQDKMWTDPAFLSSVNKNDFTSKADWNRVEMTPGMGVRFNPDTGDVAIDPPKRVGDQRYLNLLGQEDLYVDSPDPISIKTGSVYDEITKNRTLNPQVRVQYATEAANDPMYVTDYMLRMNTAAGKEIYNPDDPNSFAKAKLDAKDYVNKLLSVPKSITEVRNHPSPSSSSESGLRFTSKIAPVSEPYKQEQTIVPSSFIMSEGLGVDTPGFNAFSKMSNDDQLKNAGKLKVTMTQRGDMLRAFALKMNASGQLSASQYNLVKAGISNLNAVIGSSDITTEDGQRAVRNAASELENQMSLNNITIPTSSALAWFKEKAPGMAGTSAQENMLSQWMSGSSRVSPNKSKQIVEQLLIDNPKTPNDASTVKRNWSVNIDGKVQTVEGTIVRIQKYKDGTKDAVFIVNVPGRDKGNIVYAPYDSFMRDQIELATRNSKGEAGTGITYDN
jgi:hypothetical protein